MKRNVLNIEKEKKLEKNSMRLIGSKRSKKGDVELVNKPVLVFLVQK